LLSTICQYYEKLLLHFVISIISGHFRWLRDNESRLYIIYIKTVFWEKDIQMCHQMLINFRVVLLSRKNRKFEVIHRTSLFRVFDPQGCLVSRKNYFYWDSLEGDYINFHLEVKSIPSLILARPSQYYKWIHYSYIKIDL
jgi:hypothetical protein